MLSIEDKKDSVAEDVEGGQIGIEDKKDSGTDDAEGGQIVAPDGVDSDVKNYVEMGSSSENEDSASSSDSESASSTNPMEGHIEDHIDFVRVKAQLATLQDELDWKADI